MESAGFTDVVSTTDPRDVLARWPSLQPDILLLDIMMPGLDGFEVMEALEAATWTSKGIYVPILVLTADVSRETRRRALAAGARDFLNKPFDHDEVRLRINNLLEARALHMELREANHDLEEKVAARTSELQASLRQLESAHHTVRTSREETIQRLSMAAELRDDDTGHHILRMSRYTSVLAREAGIDPGRCSDIELAAQMHDVGKIGIPDGVLQKPGRLTPEERAVMERHAQIGHDVLSGSSSGLLDLAALIALTHHERMDGTGYPNGLRGDEIPIEGRLASVADVFDALTSDRVYRPALSVDETLAVMKEGRGSQFDPVLLDLLLENVGRLMAIREHIATKGALRERSEP